LQTSDGLGAEISTFAQMYEPPTVAEEHPAFISYAKMSTDLKGFIMVVLHAWIIHKWPAWYGLPLCNGIATTMFRQQRPVHSTF